MQNALPSDFSNSEVSGGEVFFGKSVAAQRPELKV
jgi:hypothetical protein